jgi:hypothetical protein
MSMSLPEMVEKVEEARAAWEIILNREKRPAGIEGTHLLASPPLWKHFSILPFVFEKARACGFDPHDIIDQLGFGKLVELAVDTLPPELQEHHWLSLAGMIASYDPGRDSHLRAPLGGDWERRLLEGLPAAVRLAFNESQPGEGIAPDVRGRGKSVASRTKHLLLKTGDEAADKRRRVTAKRLEPEHMELALFAQQAAGAASDVPEADFLDYLSNLKPHQGGPGLFRGRSRTARSGIKHAGLPHRHGAGV